MSPERKEIEVNLSTAALWPWSSFRSTEWAERLATKIGCDGLEILPGYSVVREFQQEGKLKTSRVSSLHQDWRRDRRAEKSLGLKISFTNYAACLFFPPEETCFQTIQGLERIYGVPVVFHWKQDTPQFQKPMLEIHPLIKASPNQIVQWVEENPEKRGLVIDISQRKFGDYLAAQNIPQYEWRRVFAMFLPFTKEVQFQIGNENELRQVRNEDCDSSLGRATREIKKQNFKGPFVIELNFPLMFKDFGRDYPEFYSQVVKFIRKA
ncbi:MAG TPA: hypothetical protein VMX76_01725 [Nevskiaceae bacterium]|nr:hypothetical protein [Nevskiaceae bacterium]